MVLDSPFSSLTKLMGELAQVYPLLPAGASIGPFFRNLAMRLLGLPVALWPERRGVAHSPALRAGQRRAPAAAERSCGVQSAAIPRAADDQRAAVRGRPARELRHRADGTCALFFWRRPCAAPRVHRLARGLGSPRPRLHWQGHRAADIRRPAHWQVEVVQMLSMPCLFAHASDVRRPPRPALPAQRRGRRAAPSGRRFVRGARARPTRGSARVASRGRSGVACRAFTSPPVAVHAAQRGVGRWRAALAPPARAAGC